MPPRLGKAARGSNKMKNKTVWQVHFTAFFFEFQQKKRALYKT